MKTSSSDLFLLIKSMTKSEKGYFKKLSNLTKGDKVYLRLFDAIEAQHQYDENKLREKFKGEQFVKQISVAKNNLYSQILRSLNQSAISGNFRFELRTNATNAEILFNKGLNGQSLKMISKLKSQAMEIEEFDILLQLINLQKSILLKSFAGNENELVKIQDEELEIIEKKRNYSHYQKLFNASFRLITKYGHLRNKAEEKQYDEILNNKFMKDKSLANSVMSKIHYNEILLYFYVAKRQFSDALELTTKSLNLIEENPAFLSTHTDKYLSLYQNHILQFFYLQRYAELEKHSQRLIAILNNRKLSISERVRVSSEGKLLCIRFVAFMNSVDLNSAAKAFEETKKIISGHNNLLDNSIKIILFNQACYYNFMTGNYPEALVWINKLLNEPEMKYFVESYCNARWFELLIHFELKNYEYIDNVLKTNKRFLGKKEKIYGIEKLMIKFFEQAVGSKSTNDKELFKKLLLDLNKITSKQTEADYGIDYYNVTNWAESKIENLPLRTYLERMR